MKDTLPTMSSTAIGAFFDLDGTLLSVNSMRLWVTHQRKLGLLGWKDAFEGASYTALYRFKVLDMNTLAEKALATVAGELESDFEVRLQEFFRSSLLRFIPRRAQAAVEEHRAKGHSLVLLTSASPYESRAAVAHFGLDDFICSHCEVVAGRFTGKAIRPVCYAEGKVELAEAWAKQHGVNLDESYFYSDSFTDAPMLSRVGHPRVVNPDLRLRLLAWLRGWPLVDWS